MNLFSTIVLYGVPCSLILSAVILAMALRNPRFLLKDYPRDIRAAAPPKTPAERRASAYWAALYYRRGVKHQSRTGRLSERISQRFRSDLFVQYRGLADLGLADCVRHYSPICGDSRHREMAGYKNYGMHFRGFLIGTHFSIALSMLIAALSVYLIPLL